MDNEWMESQKLKLERRQKELDLRVNNLEHELDAPKSQDWSENAQEGAGDEVLEELGNTGIAEIRAIDAALDRINEGVYGICVKCGGEISHERLDLVPQTPFCKKCA